MSSTTDATPQHLHTNQIMAIATEIKQSTAPNKKDYFAAKYEAFAKAYPALLNLCCDDSASLDHLPFLLRKLDQVRQNRMSEHDASVMVGQRLVDTYVKPLISDGGAPPS